MNRRSIIIAILLVLVIQIIPFAFAISAGDSQRVFAGFLLNPIDGNSYLAKMQEGWSGSWLFTLPYTAQAGEGAYIFLFYLFLGHFAHILGTPVIFMFHAARICSGALLVLALAQFTNILFTERPKAARNAFWLALIGSGSGWVAAILTGYLPGDFWVAEAYPFLSMYANPHFPLGLAIILWIGCLDMRTSTRWRPAWLAILGLCLAVIQPFGLVIAGVLLASHSLVQWVLEKKLHFSSLIFCMVLGGPYLLYQFASIQNDPMLASWNQQNVTPALPVWDFFIALMPGFFLAGLGGWQAWKIRHVHHLTLLLWIIFSIALVYLPFNLQRRFMTGLYVPVACLAILGAEWLQQHYRKTRKWLVPALFALAVPTNLILLISGIVGAQSLAPNLFMDSGEAQAMSWLKMNTGPDAVVLASSDVGLFIPAQTGQKVIYGHPFESVNAIESKAEVEDWFGEKMNPAESGRFLDTHRVEYVFIGPREQALCAATACEKLAGLVADSGGSLVYQQDGVRIYKIKP